MKLIKKTLIAASIAAAVGMSGAATAGVLASSTFSITNFLLSNNATGATLNAGDFTSLVATNNGGVSSSLVGAGSAGSSFNLPITDTNSDLLRACVGGGCGLAPGENNFTVLTPPPAGGNFANADQLLVGSALNLGPLPTTGANARVRSDVSLTGTGDGTANADVGLNASFIFSLVNNINIGVNFNGSVDLIAFTDVGTTFPGNAQASSSLAIVLTQIGGPVIFSFGDTFGSTGCGLNSTLSTNAPFNIPSTYSCNGLFTGTTGVLTAGTAYRLSIRQNSNADALFIPEPGVLSLMGLGLLGIGAALRKRKSA